MILSAIVILVIDVLMGCLVILTQGLAVDILVLWVPLSIVEDWIAKRIRITHPGFSLLLRIVSWVTLIIGGLMLLVIVMNLIRSH